jgi:NAD(P)-dependent dehydrogenase (short-subunit alcohol dehydrogenase family)
MRLKGRTAIVTGAGHGIGRAIALRLGAEEAAVAIADIDGSAAERVAEELRTTGARAVAVEVDIADVAAIAVAIHAAQHALGPPTILINNAGILAMRPALKLSASEWDSALAINLSAAFHAAQAILPLMTAAGWGRIVNISSMMAVTAFGEDAAYCSTKAGLLGLTRSLAAEFGPYNVCVNAVCPGNVTTRLMADAAASIERRDGLESGSFMHKRAQAIPLRRLGLPEDVAAVVAFLCSSDADYVTGQAIHVNGGLFYG